MGFFCSMKKSLLLLFLAVGAMSMLFMAMQYYQSVDAGVLETKPASRSAIYLFFFYIHISGGLVGMLIGPFQFISSWRRKYPKLHRGLGTAYYAGIFSSGFAGLCIAPFAMGGAVSQTGFFTLGLVWLFVTGMGLRTILQGRYREHGQWMIRSYALTFATIPQRTLLLFALFTPIPFLDLYRLSAWLPWIMQLILAQWIINIQRHKQPNLDLAMS